MNIHLNQKESIMKLINNISPHGKKYVEKALDNDMVEVFYYINSDENQGIFLRVNDEECSIFYASFKNESYDGKILDIIKNKTEQYISTSI